MRVDALHDRPGALLSGVVAQHLCSNVQRVGNALHIVWAHARCRLDTEHGYGFVRIVSMCVRTCSSSNRNDPGLTTPRSLVMC